MYTLYSYIVFIHVHVHINGVLLLDLVCSLQGVMLAPEKYDALVRTVDRDCKVLQSFGIMDYSLLVGIHNMDSAVREQTEVSDLCRREGGGEREGDGEREESASSLLMIDSDLRISKGVDLCTVF